MSSYQKVDLSKIHLPSFTSAVKYISHFRSATSMYISYLTWDDDRVCSSNWATDVARVRSGNFYKMKNEESSLNVMGCTDTVRLFLQALIANTRSPLYAISDDPQTNDRVAMIDILQAICPRILGVDRQVEIDIVCEYDGDIVLVHMLSLSQIIGGRY